MSRIGSEPSQLKRKQNEISKRRMGNYKRSGSLDIVIVFLVQETGTVIKGNGIKRVGTAAICGSGLV